MATVVGLGACSTPADDGAGLRSATTTETSASGPTTPPPSSARSEERWVEVTLCTDVGPLRVQMPGPVHLEGPRSLRHIAPPAQGTFALSYGSTDDRRYDAFVIHSAGAEGDTAEARMERVLRTMDGDPGVVELGATEAVGDHVEVPYEETFNDRRLYAHGFALADIVIAIDVGVRAGSPTSELDIARADLARMRATIQLPDPGRPTDCASSQVPLDEPPSDEPTSPDPPTTTTPREV
ncbi:hypothetical protein PO878_00705 [Iamia majanohamensis]|uniref:Uncharacterized protein n=1 Tax=Iamia majanohamensis TaxID=467976 RepID=A0AAE9YG91_9ACTN|nr:hypothetical protein [Iamia majanohamensis]WCO67241.1 hypothetical protein PO878_00705 [Iamia majanohamensis]